MKQVVIIHGGTTFSSREKYLDYLKNKQIQIDRLVPSPTWKNSLQSELGDDYLVLCPSMPNSTNADYEEWKLYFDRVCEVMTDNAILIGHSLGGIFLVKYLSEHKLAQSITATILIAAPFDDESDEDLTNFKITQVPELFTEQAGKIVFFNGADDPVVSIDEMHRYRKVLPTADYIIQSAPDHFVRAHLPELTATILSL